MVAASVIVAEPSEKTLGSVRLPSEVVVPHSNHPAEDPPPVTRNPFNWAEFEVTPVASFVVTDGVGTGIVICEYPATTAEENTHTNIPTDRANFIVPPLVMPPWLRRHRTLESRP